MTKIEVFTHCDSPFELRPASVKRDWMDSTSSKHAYRCLPLTTMNTSGWELLLPQDVVVKLEEGEVASVLEGEYYKGRQICSKDIMNGMVSFHCGHVFKADSGYCIEGSGPPNLFVEGAQCLSFRIPASWWTLPFQFSWKITQRYREIRFPAGMPIMFFRIFPEGLLESTEVNLRGRIESSEYAEVFNSYGPAIDKSKLEGTWTNNMRSGLVAGKQIGPKFTGLSKLKGGTVGE